MSEQKLYKVQIERTVSKLYTVGIEVWASSEEAAQDIAHDRATNKYIKGWYYVPGCEADEVQYDYYVDTPEA
jgi:hypothetical protein